MIDTIGKIFRMPEIVHRNLFVYLAKFIVIALVAAVVNTFCKPLNGLIGFAVVIMIAWAATKPALVLSFVTAGVVLSEENEKRATSILLSTLTWVSAIFMFGATLEFKQNIGAVLVILPAIITLALAEFGWDYKTRLARPFAICYAIVVTVICFVMLVPSGIWYRTIGTNPVSANQISDAEKNLIDSIEKLEKRGAVTAQEKANLVFWKKQLKERSWAGKISKVFETPEPARTASVAPVAPPAAPAPKQQVAVAVVPVRNVVGDYQKLGYGTYHFQLQPGTSSPVLEMPGDRFYGSVNPKKDVAQLFTDGKEISASETRATLLPFRLVNKGSEVKIIELKIAPV